MESRQLKDKANEALSQGRFARAAHLFEQYCALDPQDHQARVRLGDAWVKVGDKARAISAYQAAAEGFAREGLLPRAIAASKLILELDSSHQGVQQMLANLYARKGGGGAPRAGGSKPVEAPAEPSALYIELPPEIDEALARDEAAGVSARPTAARSEPPEPSHRSIGEAPSPLTVEADSLLHAVELAALAGTAQPQEEPATSGPPTHDAASSGGKEPVTEEPSRSGALPKIPLFSDLPRDAFIALFERCPLHRFSEGERILEQGTRGHAFYVICSGRVRIVRQIGAEQRSLALLGEGAFFGEMALLSGSPRSASVVSASEETQVLEISAQVLADLASLFPQVARALRRFCRQRLLSNVMNTSALFQPFGRKDRRELAEYFRARDVRRGEVIIHEGHRVDGLYVVLSGEVAVTKGGQPLAQLSEGELFGEMSLLQKTPATATVTAVRYTSLLRLPREDFDTLILTHPQILALVSELTDARQRSTDALLGRRPESSTEETSEAMEPHEELVIF